MLARVTLGCVLGLCLTSLSGLKGYLRRVSCALLALWRFGIEGSSVPAISHLSMLSMCLEPRYNLVKPPSWGKNLGKSVSFAASVLCMPGVYGRFSLFDLYSRSSSPALLKSCDPLVMRRVVASPAHQILSSATSPTTVEDLLNFILFLVPSRRTDPG